MVLDEVLDEIKSFLHNKIKPYEKNLSRKLRTLRKEIGDLAYDTYRKYKERGIKYCAFQLLLGAADQSATILYVTSQGKQQILEQYGIIGTGQVTGGELLLSEFLKDGISQREAASLAALIVTKIGKIDVYVSGEPEIRWCRNRRVWHYREFKFRRIIEESRSRWNVMKRAWWKMQEDSTTKKKLRNIL